MATILFDGVAYGMTLFVLSVGLGVTLGLMNFVNLAHGAFAMLGGYVAALAMARAGAPFLLALPLAFAASALVGAALERTLYRRLYGAHPLDQVLFTIGLVFMATPTANWFLGDQPYQVRPPAWLETRVHLGALEFGAYRLFLIVVCGAIALGLQLFLVRTRFGARLRAAVDDPRTASAMGIDVGRLFAATFAFGSGLAGLGGALAADLVGGVDSSFPLRFMTTFLIVVAVGGQNGVLGAFFGAILLGLLDVAGKYYVPSLGAFVIYAAMVATLVARPQGLFAKADRR